MEKRTSPEIDLAQCETIETLMDNEWKTAKT